MYINTSGMASCDSAKTLVGGSQQVSSHEEDLRLDRISHDLLPLQGVRYLIHVRRLPLLPATVRMLFLKTYSNVRSKDNKSINRHHVILHCDIYLF